MLPLTIEGIMLVSEQRKRDLFTKVRDHLGEEIATLLLEVTVPANVEFATRGDLQELRAEMLFHFAAVEQRFAAVEQRMGGLEATVAELGRDLTRKLYAVVIPVISTITLVLLALATWLGAVLG